MNCCVTGRPGSGTLIVESENETVQPCKKAWKTLREPITLLLGARIGEKPVRAFMKRIHTRVEALVDKRDGEGIEWT